MSGSISGSFTPILPLNAVIDMSALSSLETQLGGRLLRLPAEIRVMIYEHMFLLDVFKVYAINGKLHKAADAHHLAGDYTTILTTCRAIYTEAKPVLYTNMEFIIHVKDDY